MVKWEILDDRCDPRFWDEIILGAADHNVFQSYGWGEYKRFLGRYPVRCIAMNTENKIVAAVQILLESFPLGVRIGWAPGGPCFRFPRSREKEIDGLLNSLFKCIQETFGKRIFVRFNSCVPTSHEHAYVFNKACARPFFKLNSGFSMLLDLTSGYEDFIKGMTSKHRYYTKKALSSDTQWGADEDMEALLSIHNEMVETKRMEVLKVERYNLSNMRRCLKDSSIFFTGYANGKAVASCLVLTFGKKAFYMTAAAGARGRELNASYAMISNLAQHLRERGFEELDLGGIDPCSALAAGTNHFKKGFGGKLVEYLGEWEWAFSEPLRWMVNLALRSRGGRL